MRDSPENLMLVLLRRMDTKLDRMEVRIDRFERRLDTVPA